MKAKILAPIILLLANFTATSTGAPLFPQSTATANEEAVKNEKKIITIAGDNWCPINCSQQNSGEQDQGYMIDVAREALALQGYQLNYLEIPWTRAVGLARKGQIDGIVGAFHGDAPDFIFPKRALLNISPSSLFTVKDSDWQYHGLASINQVTLGSIKGYDYGEALNSYINSLLTTESEQLVQLYGNNVVERSIQFLLKRRVDVLVESAPVFWYHAKQLKVTEKLQHIADVSPKEPCFIAFSPLLAQSQTLSQLLDSGVKQLSNSGRLEQIADKYGLPASSYTNTYE